MTETVPQDLLDLPLDATLIAEAAVLYARAGFAPVPVHGVSGGTCMCGDDHCKAVGKHPVGSGWQKRAKADVDVARELFTGHEGNVGIVVGEAHVVLDVDYYAGGKDGLAELPPMPPTLTGISGSGQGEHRIFVYGPGQDPAEVTNRKIAPGVDIKTRSGQIVVAPSLHVSGNRYRWADASPPAELPHDLYERIRKNRVIPIRPPRPTGRPSNLSRRAEAYLAKCAPAVSGSGGHAAAFAAARACWGWIGKGLPESEGWRLLLDYNTRCSPPWNERELQHKWSEAQKADRIPMPEDRNPDPPSDGPPPSEPPSEPPTPDGEPDWRRQLIYRPQKSGPAKLEKHLANAVVILRFDPRWRGRFVFDEHAQRTLVREPPWHPSEAPTVTASEPAPTTDALSPLGAAEGWREWKDADNFRLSGWLRREYSTLNLSSLDCDRAVTVVAEANRRHPFREYLDGLVWDGVPRLASWLSDYLDAPPGPYAARVGTWWLTSAVARIYTPGCKADYVLILEGNQGIRKSTALRTLCGAPWFTDTPLDLGSKDAYQGIQGKVVVELGELTALKKADQDRAKVFFSSQVDRYRDSYGRRACDVPRACIFAGTVNPEQSGYFSDATGNRRYWPVRCGSIDLVALATARDQIWGEAVHRFRQGGRWWPEGDEHLLCADEQEPRAQVDSWEEPIGAWCDGRDVVTMTEVLSSALKIDLGHQDKTVQMRASRVLKILGYERCQQVRSPGLIHGARVWGYRKKGTR